MLDRRMTQVNTLPVHNFGRSAYSITALAIHPARRNLATLNLGKTFHESVHLTNNRVQPRTVRRDHDPWVTPQRRIRRKRFHLEDIQGGAANPAAVERFGNEGLIHDGATPCIDEDC